MAQDRYLLYCEAVPGCCFQLDVTDPAAVVKHLKTHPGLVPVATRTLTIECPRCDAVLYEVPLAVLDQEPSPGNLLRGWTHVTRRGGECPRLNKGDAPGHKFRFKSFY